MQVRTRLALMIVAVLTLSTVLFISGKAAQSAPIAKPAQQSGQNGERHQKIKKAVEIAEVMQSRNEGQKQDAMMMCSATVTPQQRESEARIFATINLERQLRGIPELVWSDQLADLAREHSCRMRQLGFFSHDDPERGNARQRLTNAGIWWEQYAEIVYRESCNLTSFVVPGWMSSPGHQRNILDALSTQVGVGITVGADEKCFFTAIFIGDGVLAAKAEAENPNEQQCNPGCGLDITDALMDGLKKVEEAFDSKSTEDKRAVCKGVRSVTGWDINTLIGDNPGKFLTKGNCGTGACADTVTVNGECHMAFAVNYILWGKINRLCFNSLRLPPMEIQDDSKTGRGMLPERGNPIYSLDAAVQLAGDYRLVKTLLDWKGVEAPLLWTKVGWTGKFETASKAKRDKTCPPCSDKFNKGVLSFRLAPTGGRLDPEATGLIDVNGQMSLDKTKDKKK